MIFVAQQAVLACHAAAVTGLAEVLFHRTEIGCEILRIALLVALQIGAGLLKGMATLTLLDGTGQAQSRPMEVSTRVAIGRYKNDNTTTQRWFI